MGKIRVLSDVVDWRMCVGCGACASVCPDERVKLWDFPSEGIRPVVDPGDCEVCTACRDVCPGVSTDFGAGSAEPDPFEEHWGTVIAVYEGHATDPEIRFKGSSGGVLTALAAYCVEKADMHGVLHTGQDPEDPTRNRTRLSRSRADLLAATGSRYAPASVCNGFGLVEAAPTPCVIIGQPSDVAGVAKARRLRPELDRKIGVILSFFCAGSPPTSATHALLGKMGVDPTRLGDLRYRGLGWPGNFAPTLKGRSDPAKKMTYHDSWAFLQAYRPWSVQLWPDGSGELADISCGDPWYVEPDGRNPGSSIVLARTQRGLAIIKAAISEGYLQAAEAERWKVERSQAGLWRKKGSVWGRQLALRLLRVPTTRITGGHLWECWRSLSMSEKVRSTLGTINRVIKRRLFEPMILSQEDAVPVKPAAHAASLARREVPGPHNAAGGPNRGS